MLLYNKLVEYIEAYGFNINPYDPCVANKIINGKKMIVTYYVNDIKVSHQDAFEMTKFATYLSDIYGKKLTVHRGKLQYYQGMDL